MLDDKDEFDVEVNHHFAFIGRLAAINITRWAEGVARRRVSMPEKFKEDCIWLRSNIDKWQSHIDVELRRRGVLPHP